MRSLSRVIVVTLMLGTLGCSAGAARAGTKTWAAAVNGSWSDGTKWQGGQAPLPGDDVVITVAGTYTVDLDQAANLNSLTLGASSGAGVQTLSSSSNQALTVAAASTINAQGDYVMTGSLTANGALTVAGALDWASNTLSGSGSVTVSNGGHLNLSGTNNKTLELTLNNAGTILWTGGDLSLGSGTLNNQSGGAFTIQCDNNLNSSFGTNVVSNQSGATLSKNTTTGTTAVGVPLNSAGSINVQTGTLSLNNTDSSSGGFTVASGALLSYPSGAHTLTSGAALNGSGTVRVSGGTLTLASGATVAAAGTFEQTAGQISGPGTLTINNVMNWTGGTLGDSTGTLTIPAGKTLNLSGASNKSLEITLNNAGTILWTGGDVYFGSGTLNNQSGGAFTIQCDNNLNSSFGTTAFNNQSGATATKDTTAGTNTVGVPFNNNGGVSLQSGTLSLNNTDSSSGSFTVASGALLSYPSGAHTLTSGAAFNGSGTVRVSGGTLTLASGATVAAAGTFEQTAGQISGPGTLTINNVMNWTGGTLGDSTGTLTIPAGKTLNLSGASNKSLEITLNNAGTILWTGGDVYFGSGTLNNQSGGAFTIQCDNNLNSSFGTTAFNNQSGATATKDTTAGTNTVGVPFNNNGILRATKGTITLNGGGTSAGAFNISAAAVVNFNSGTQTLNSGSSMLGSGTGRVTGGQTSVTGTTSVSANTTLEVAGGTLDTGGSLNVNGTLLWTGGTISGAGSLNVTAAAHATISGSNSKSLNDTINNAGTTLWTGGDVFCGSGTWTNTSGASFTVQCDNNWNSSFGSNALNIRSGATFTKNTTSGTNGFGVGFNNDGDAEIQTGTVSLTGSDSSGGSFNVASGAVLNFASATHTLKNGATLSGAGTAQLSSGTVTVAPNATATVAGTFTTTGGTLNGTGTLAVVGVLSALGGTFSDSTGKVNISATGQMSLNGNLSLGRTFNNAGATTWVTSDLSAGGLTWNNLSGGTFTTQSNNTFTASFGTNKFNNQAGSTFVKAVVPNATGNSDINFPFTNSGTINVLGGNLRLNGGLANFSNNRLTGGTYDLVGILQFNNANIITNSANVTLDGANSAIVDQSLANGLVNFASNAAAGTFTLANGRNLTTIGVFTNSGLMNLGTGCTFTVPSGKSYNQTANATLLNGVLAAETVIQSGSLTGAGAVQGNLTSSGQVNPGNTLGILTVTGAYTQRSAGVLNIELGGTIAGSQYDRLKVNGKATLAGTLNLLLVNGFVPVPGNSFQIVNYAPHAGKFAPVNGLNPGNGHAFTTTYNPGNLTIGTRDRTITINNVTVTEGDSGSVNAAFKITLSDAAVANVTVKLATADGTATSTASGNLPADYTAVGPTTLTFTPGQVSKTVNVPVLGDLVDENTEQYTVNLSNATNATIAKAQGVGTILDNDPAPALSINDVSVNETNSGTVNAVFNVSLSAPSGKTVTVKVATANGTATAPADYTAVPLKTLTFAPGVTSLPVTVKVVGDLLDEPQENFFVNLSSPANATIADAQGVGTILNNDPTPSLSINSRSILEGNTGSKNLAFTVTLSAKSGRTVTVTAATADGTATAGSDYTAVPPTVLTFSPGQTMKLVDVPILGDTTDEPNETFFVNLTNPSNATMATAQGVGTINDDDAPPTISVADAAPVAEGGSGTTTTAHFTVSLSAASGKTVTVKAATANGTAKAGSDYVALPATMLTFTPGVTSLDVPVTVNGDSMDEVNETFFLNLSSPTNATLADKQGQGTILDDDPAPTLSIGNRSVQEGNSGTTNMVFTVKLSAASGKMVTVHFATADGTATAGSDYTAQSGSVTFAPGQTVKTITVLVTGDTVAEPDETLFVNLTSPINATITTAQGVGTILNDDSGP